MSVFKFSGEAVPVSDEGEIHRDSYSPVVSVVAATQEEAYIKIIKAIGSPGADLFWFINWATVDEVNYDKLR